MELNPAWLTKASQIVGLFCLHNEPLSELLESFEIFQKLNRTEMWGFFVYLLYQSEYKLADDG